LDTSRGSLVSNHRKMFFLKCDLPVEGFIHVANDMDKVTMFSTRLVVDRETL